ncbi:MAG: MBL fold metallo-hydrolase [Aigarchaeota archaeon]|nr:MBL fold metallo-hydrolase [Candidatus Pelearchaeum maunauluense]
MSRFSTIFDGLYRIRIDYSEGGIGHVNVFLIQNKNDEYTMVDAGFHSTSRELLSTIHDELGNSIRISRLIITHIHYDHYGGVNQVIARFSPSVMMHRREMEVINALSRAVSEEGVSWLRLLGVQDIIMDKVLKIISQERKNIPRPNQLINEGLSIESISGIWRIIHTPGHTPGHVCLYNNDNGALISGDHLLPEETSNVPFYPIKGYNPLRDYLASLTMVKRIRPSIVIPSHGEPFSSAESRIGELYHHHNERLRQTLEALLSGESKITEVARQIKWSRGHFDTLSALDKWLALLETISHLEFLCWCGVVVRKIGDDIHYEVLTGDFTPVEAKLAELSTSP